MKRRINQVRAADEAFIKEWEEKKVQEESELARRRASASAPSAATKEWRTQLKLSWSSKKYTFTVEKLKEVFAKLGEVEFVQIYGKKKNRGVIRFKHPETAALALLAPASVSADVKGK